MCIRDRYYYSIGPIGSILQGDANNYFYTAPANGSSQAVKFWVTGDFGMGSANQIAVRNSFAAYTAGQAVNGWPVSYTHLTLPTSDLV